MRVGGCSGHALLLSDYFLPNVSNATVHMDRCLGLVNRDISYLKAVGFLVPKILFSSSTIWGVGVRDDIFIHVQLQLPELR